MSHNAPFTVVELARCAEREVQQRRRVYPRLVMKGAMRQDVADRETHMMLEIARRLNAEAETDPRGNGRLV
ncbi:MAG: hypothetical protein ACJ8FU_08295 [Xanthobacteraceae bacterium]